MRKTWLIPSLIAVVALSACAPAAVPVETAAPEALVTPTAEPEPAGPERVFGGDCGAVATAGAVSADLGAAMTLEDLPWQFEAGYVAIAQLGGIHCVWSSGVPGAPDAVWATVVVLPSRSITEAVDHGIPCEGAYCYFGATVAGFEVFGAVAGPTDVTAASAALTARLSNALGAQPVPEAYSPAGVWPTGVECASLDPDRRIGTALGDPSMVGFPYGGDAEGNVGFYVAYRAAGVGQCVWSSETIEGSPSAIIDILGGGAWIYDDIAARPDVTEVTVPGLDRALVNGDTFYGFLGTNRIAVTLDPQGSQVAVDALYGAAAAIAADLATRG